MGFSLGDLNPAKLVGQGINKIKNANWGWMGDESESAKQQRADMNEQGKRASDFAGEGEAGYGMMTMEAAHEREALRRLAEGKDSYSAEQLRQGLQQQQAAQQSMAAGASPQNSAMAARTAMTGMGRAGAQMSGQAALAGIQERRAARELLGNMIMGARGQDLQAALGSRQNALGGYGGIKPEGSWMDKYGGAASAGLGAAAKSDRRLKKDIEDGDAMAKRALKKIASYSYKYKDEKHGKGEQLGVMAQELEGAGLRHVVRDAPDGKEIDAAKLSGTNTALIAALARRVGKLENADRASDADDSDDEAPRRKNMSREDKGLRAALASFGAKR